MFKCFTRACALSLGMCSLSLPAQAMDKLIIDKNHSYVLWHVNHLGFSTQAGKWFVDGTLYLDKQNLKNSKVDVTINVASMDTGNPELDTHLKGKEFFDVAHFPLATFKSEKVEPEGSDAAKVTGVLNLHGVSKPVVLMVKFNKEGINPIYDRNTLGFTATTDIKRSDYGINTLVPQIGDDVHIDINAEAYQPKS